MKMLKINGFVLLSALLIVTVGCNKKKKTTTPRPTETGPAYKKGVRVSSKGQKLLKCNMPKGAQLVALDLNRDKKIDRWLLIADGNVMVCREMDMNYDGRRDLSIRYFDDGTTARVIWWDLDYDGYFDQVMYNRPDGTKLRVEVRPHPPTPKEMKADWKPTIWKFYRNIKGKGTVIDRIEMDKDRNGFKDYWERYEDGVLKEVSWSNPGDTDEKPKHWIEAPEPGQDKGYRGRDEPKRARPAPREAPREPARRGSK